MKIGDYVRIDGYISKIEHIRTSSSGRTYVQWKQPNGLLASGNINIIEKSSPRIIDLIEVGDYVNGYRVSYSGGFYQYWDDMFDENTIETDKDIKSIVTKEQFEGMKYNV